MATETKRFVITLYHHHQYVVAIYSYDTREEAEKVKASHLKQNQEYHVSDGYFLAMITDTEAK